MTDIDPVHRLDTKEAKDRLGIIVNSMAPESLLIKPDNAEHGLPWYPAYYYFLMKKEKNKRKESRAAVGSNELSEYEVKDCLVSMLQAQAEALLLKFGPQLVVLYFPKLYPSNSGHLPSITSPSFLFVFFRFLLCIFLFLLLSFQLELEVQWQTSFKCLTGRLSY